MSSSTRMLILAAVALATSCEAFSVVPQTTITQRATTTQLQGVQNPPPNETTGLKALGFLGSAGAILGLIVAPAFVDLPTVSVPSTPATEKKAPAKKQESTAIKSPVAVSKKSSTTTTSTPKRSVLKESGYNFDNEVVKDNDTKASRDAAYAKAVADRTTALEAAKKARIEEQAAQKVALQKAVEERAAAKAAQQAEAAAKKAEALEKAVDKDSKKAAVKAQVDAEAGEAEADKKELKDKKDKAVAEEKKAKQLLKEKEVAEAKADAKVVAAEAKVLEAEIVDKTAK